MSVIPLLEKEFKIIHPAKKDYMVIKKSDVLERLNEYRKLVNEEWYKRKHTLELDSFYVEIGKIFKNIIGVLPTDEEVKK